MLTDREDRGRSVYVEGVDEFWAVVCRGRGCELLGDGRWRGRGRPRAHPAAKEADQHPATVQRSKGDGWGRGTVCIQRGRSTCCGSGESGETGVLRPLTSQLNRSGELGETGPATLTAQSA